MQPQSKLNQGFVYLVGSGPGSPDLITLRGIQCLKKAQVVLYDGLVNPRILTFAHPAAELISVGKHGSQRIWTQPEIDEAVVSFAKQGKIVVRLKGGDPAIFARTAEELDRLVRENIPFEVVPGVTAAVAASAATGIPLTHRDWASAVAFVTAHSQAIDGGDEAEESLDWNALARFPGTLVFYMGVTTAARWSQNLIEAGKPPTTPVAIVRRCSWHDQQVVTCQLAEVAQRLTPASAFRPPVLTIVGNVAQFYPQLDWFMQRPLFGTTILVTRPRQQAESLTQQLEELGAEVIHYAAIHIEPVQNFTQLDAILHSQGSGSPQKLTFKSSSSVASQPYDWIIFSSRNGVDAFFTRLHELQYDARQLGQAKIAAVGPGTAASLAAWHVTCQCTPDSQYGADALADKLVQQVAGQRCLIVTGSRSRDTLAERLKQSSATVDVVVVYRNVDETIVDERLLQRMHRGEVHYTTVTSSSIAKSVVNLFGDALRHTRLISISPLTSSTLRELGFEPFLEAPEASVAELIPS